MEINLSAKPKIYSDLTPNHFMVLKMVHHGDNYKDIVAKFERYGGINSVYYVRQHLLDLYHMGLIDDVYSPRLTEYGDKHFPENFDVNKAFNEFWSIYPYSVKNPSGGRRVVRIEKNKCIKIYILHITTQAKHEKVISLLKEELADRTKNNNLPYMPNSARWLRQKKWKESKEYEGRAKEKCDWRNTRVF